MKSFVIAAAASAALFASPAMAQDATPTGLYFGALTGWDHLETKGDLGSGGKDGVVFGAIVGYDAKIGGSALVGVEAEIDGATTKRQERDLLVTGDRGAIKSGRDLYAGVRLGFEASPGLVIYAKGGYTNAKIIAEYDDGAGFKESERVVADGFRLGGGVQKTLTSRISARLEYRYSDYGTLRYQGFSLDQDARRQQVVFALTGTF